MTIEVGGLTCNVLFAMTAEIGRSEMDIFMTFSG